jgi:hypothetical protein
VAKPGPVAHPARRLADAALLYAVAVESETKCPKREWDRLVKAALHYRSSKRPVGRPLGVE